MQKEDINTKSRSAVKCLQMQVTKERDRVYWEKITIKRKENNLEK